MNAFYKILQKQLLLCTFSSIQGIDGTNLKKDPEKLKLVEQVVQDEDVMEVRRIT